MKRLLKFCVFALCLASCARAPIEDSRDSLRLTTSEPNLRESLPLLPLAQAIEREMEHLLRYRSQTSLQFGERRVSVPDYVRGLGHFLELLHHHKDYGSLWNDVRRDFDIYETYGREDWGDVFITSYYEPLIEGARKPTGNLTQPLYALPDDLVEIRIREFGDTFADAPSAVRGRLVQSKDGAKEVVPYYSRSEIDEGKELRGQGLELFYVDPIESFFLQIQGSGTIRLADGSEYRVGYAGQNGHSYEPVGKFLKHAIPIEEMTLQRIESYLRSIPPSEMQAYLNKNPSYIFFKPIKENALTFLGVPATAGRTIAIDRKYNPIGALGILEHQEPVFDPESESPDPVAWRDVANFVLAQDVGGAIKGPGRVDLFWGRGPKAKAAAGLIKQNGKLYFFAPKERLLSELRLKGSRSGISSL